MNFNQKIITGTLALLVVAGCQNTPIATTYHPFDRYDGYSDRPVSENSYEIQGVGNAITTHETMVNQFNKRGQELCKCKPIETEIKKEVSTNLYNAQYISKYHSTPTTVNQIPYVTGKVTCSK